MEAERRVGGLALTATSREAAIVTIAAAVAVRTATVFAFCNAHTVNLARRDEDFRAALSQTTLFNDGVGMDLAGRLLGYGPFPNNLNGTDLTPAVLARLPRATRIYLLGSPAGVAAAAGDALAERFPCLNFVGADHGYFDAVEEERVIARIRASGAALVLVGMGQPRQENWAVAQCDALGCTLLCVGAYLDFAAGRFRRAPTWVRTTRLEWLFRLALEPRRLAGRYLVGNFIFIATILGDRCRRR